MFRLSRFMRTTCALVALLRRNTVSKATLCAVLLIAVLGVCRLAHADIVVAWGDDAGGQLGDGKVASFQTTPVLVVGLNSDVTMIAAGAVNGYAIEAGTLYAWGRNPNGNVGDGTNRSKFTPVNVVGLTQGVTSVAGGGSFALAIQNEAAYSWGYNFFGQVGNGTDGLNTDQIVPAPVTGLTSGVTAIAAGYGHSLAIQNGAIYAWGWNQKGQLGDGTNVNRSIPVPINGLTSGVTAIAAGNAHSLAIQNGAVYAWGENSGGAVGDGTTINRNSPVPVVGLGDGVTAIAAGAGQSFAVKNGYVYGWGIGPIFINSSVPIQLDPADLHDIITVASGESAIYALSSDGSLWVWGHNEYGQLGLGTTSHFYSTPQHLLPPDGYLFTSIDSDSGVGHHAVATMVAVPEPASLLLLALGGTILLHKMRRCRTAQV